MPSEVDQAVSPQSIQERLGAVFSAPTAEDDVPSVDTAAISNESDQVDTDDGEENAPPAESAIEEVEIEVEGWKGKIPAKLKAEIDKGADYTRKTQALADERRLIESQTRLQQEHQAFLQATKTEHDQLRQIDAQLDQYSSVDISQVDADTLNRMQYTANQLAAQKKKLEATIGEKQGQFKTQMLGAWDDMTNKALGVIKATVPDWESKAGDVAQWAIREGFPFEVITGYDRQTRERVGPGVIDPVFARTLYKAAQWDKLQTSKASTSGKVANAPPVLKPGAPTATQATHRQKALSQQHRQKGTVDSAAALLRGYFKDKS